MKFRMQIRCTSDGTMWWENLPAHITSRYAAKNHARHVIEMFNRRAKPEKQRTLVSVEPIVPMPGELTQRGQ